jgi:hypothetical protein
VHTVHPLRLLALGLVRRPGDAANSLLHVPGRWRLPVVFSLLGCGVAAAVVTPWLLSTSATTITAALGANSWLPVVAVVLWAAAALVFAAFTAAAWAIHGVVLAVAARGAVPLRRALVLLPWLWLPLLVRMFFQAGSYLLAGGIESNGLTFLLPEYAQLSAFGQFVWHALWQIDLFFAWHVALVWVALVQVVRLHPSRALDTVLIYGLASACLHASSALLF